MKRLHLAFAALLALTAFLLAVPRTEASSCPLYRDCMILYPESWCFCEGFYCNGQFICGTPIE